MKKLLVIALLLPNLAFAGNNESYQLGANDGCQSGKNDWLHPFKKDIDKYVNDPYYKTGWDDAYNKCARDYQQMNKILEQSGF